MSLPPVATGTLPIAQATVVGWTQASRVSGIPGGTLRRRVKHGMLSAEIVDGSYIFQRADLEALRATRLPRGMASHELPNDEAAIDLLRAELTELRARFDQLQD